LFEHLSKYNTIIVTGPQRSGTLIASKMIAHDTGHLFIDERLISIDSLYRFQEAIMLQRNVVIQCPALARWIHHFADDDVLVCFMMRDLEDIKASENRIGWNGEVIEQIRYQDFNRPIAILKYEAWEKQKKVINNWMEIEYKSLENHPLWMPREKRVEFGPHQTHA
jgi:hypothetical protein